MRILLEVVLWLKVPHDWVSELTRNLPVTVRILDCRPGNEECSSLELVEISGDQGSIEQITSKSKILSGVCKIDLIKVGRGLAFGLVSTNKCIACRVFLESRCFVKSVRSRSGDIMEYVIITPGHDEFKEILRRIAAIGLDPEVKKVAKIQSISTLTSRQEQILRLAIHEGYFDYPRRVGLSKLAERIGVSKPSLLEVLRTAERKALEAFMEELPP